MATQFPPLPRPGTLVRLDSPATGFRSSERRTTFEDFLMGIFSRTRDIIAANMTDLLDKADDPAKTIRMIIMEMEDTLVEVRASAARAIADQKEMRRHITRLNDLADSWTEKAQLALAKDREDLARAALIEKNKACDMARQLTAEAAQLDDSLSSYEGDIAKLQAKLNDARARQNGIANRMESATNKVRLREAYGGEKTKDALARFELLERRADHAEGQAEALALGSVRSLEDEFSDLAATDSVEAELKKLKARAAEKEG